MQTSGTPQAMAQGAGLPLMGLARHGVRFNFDLGVNVSG